MGSRLWCLRSTAPVGSRHSFCSSSALGTLVVAGGLLRATSWRRPTALTALLAARRVSSRTSSEESLALVDGNFLLYMAFYATKFAHLENRRGEPTGAVMGFVNQLLRVQRELQPTHFAVMMDSHVSQNVRRKAHPTYKQDRKAPDELAGQFALAKDACEALGVPCQAVPGYEADDLIKTYTEEARKSCEVHIVSSDKDLAQLVNSNVWLHTNFRRFEDSIDVAAVGRKWGVRPDQMGDLLALAGDSIDSVPGVPGIGSTKAAALLRRHGNLQGVLDAARGGLGAAGVGPKLLQNLCTHAKQAAVMRQVVELMTVPEVDATAWKSFFVRERDEASLEKAKDFFYTRLNMKRVYERLSEGVSEDARRAEQQALAAQQPVVVEDLASSARVVSLLQKHSGDEGRTFAVSVLTEEDQSRPTGFSVYGGPDLDFGGSSRLWVDLTGALATKLVGAFKDFFTDKRCMKVYHCFSEQWRALLGIDEELSTMEHRGYAGDTLHMARLVNPSLGDRKREGFSLRELCKHYANQWTDEFTAQESRSKPQSVAHLRTKEKAEWIRRSSLGAVAVWDLAEKFRDTLQKRPWALEGPQLTPKELLGLHMWDFYERQWLPLGKLLLEMELAGIPLDCKRLEVLLSRAQGLMREEETIFRGWVAQRVAKEHGQDAVVSANLEHLNLNSSQQLVQLLYGGEPKSYQVTLQPQETAGGSSSSTSNPGRTKFKREELTGKSVAELKALLRSELLPVSGRKGELMARLLDLDAKPARQRSPKLQLTIHGFGFTPPEGYNTSKQKRPQISMDALKAFADQNRAELGKDGVEAVEALVRYQEVQSLVSGFLQPLRGHAPKGRVHAYLNLNTETGRLSCRRPNLQGEPLGKRLDVRAAFAAPPGQRFVIADYAQLELRVVAHLADCTPMIELLCSGGDIHSRTAYRMFSEVREAVDAGEVRLDDNSPASQAPLLKDRFTQKRRQAKVLNFSLLYGKTAFGLGKEWEISTKEAEVMIDKWFDSFPEVRRWKLNVEGSATRGLAARTLLGRSRPIAALSSRLDKAHGKRAASNTPVQGSAADIVIAAMVRLRESELLAKLGYRQILQVHDEIILQGPEEHADAALAEVISIMEDPLPFRLVVPLKVDARHSQSWGEELDMS